MSNRSDNAPTGDRSRPQLRVRLAAIAGRGLLHLTGVVFVAVVGAWAIVGTGHLRWLASVGATGPGAVSMGSEVGLHLLFSALIWGLVALVVAGIRRTKRRPGRRLVRRRAAVLTETLIVMPVLLVTVMGIAQLAVNNIARMLLNYGTSQAVRSVWVNRPEVDPIGGRPARRGLDGEDVRERARLQVAAAMTPVAPSTYEANRNIDSEAFERLRASFLAPQLTAPPGDAGADVMEDAEELDDFEASPDQSFVRTLDGSNYPARTVRKFTSAYQAVELEIDHFWFRSEIAVEVTYRHLISFPFVGPIFGRQDRVGDTVGSYMTMKRREIYTQQVPPNVEMPKR